MFDSIDSKDLPALKLRAHHICCMRFWNVISQERGRVFFEVEKEILDKLLSQPESRVMVVEGVDALCEVCPLCRDGRCISPYGDEDKVRKWDVLLLKELGISFGSCLTSGEWWNLIEQKIPYKVCHKCQWKEMCGVGASLL